MRSVVLRSLSDIDRSTAAYDPRPSASCSARKNPPCIPANTPPVFPGLRPRIWPHLLRLVTKAISDRLLDDRKTCPPKKTQRSKTKRPPPAPRVCSNVSLRQRIAAQDVRLQP